MYSPVLSFRALRCSEVGVSFYGIAIAIMRCIDMIIIIIISRSFYMEMSLRLDVWATGPGLTFCIMYTSIHLYN